MASNSDDPFRELEESVVADMRKVYSEKVIDHFLNPRNLGEIQAADGFGRVTGPCGDTAEIYLRIERGEVKHAAFWTDGCGPSIASGSMVTELVKGKNISEAREITKDDILDALEGLPEESLHCAALAANTLQEAIMDYLAFKKEPLEKGL